MKTVFLWEIGEGWKSFDLENAQAEFEKRGIRIGHEASIGDGASIGNGASIGHGASIGNRASIGHGASIVKTLFITGSKHSVNWYGTGVIHIGCHKKEISWWLENYRDMGKKEDYTEEQISEYYQYISICQQLQKAK